MAPAAALRHVATVALLAALQLTAAQEDGHASSARPELSPLQILQALAGTEGTCETPRGHAQHELASMEEHLCGYARQVSVEAHARSRRPCCMV